MKVKAYIHSLKDHEHDRHVLGEAEIIRQIGDNLYLAEVNGVRRSSTSSPGLITLMMCTASRRRPSDMRQYIFNLETTKIELHFEKSEYAALTAEQKATLKSAFLWSRSGGCWVSRAKEPNLWRAKQVAAKLGFTEEQREGERLSFSEQVERQADRAERRAERYEQYAENAERRGAAFCGSPLHYCYACSICSINLS